MSDLVNLKQKKKLSRALGWLIIGSTLLVALWIWLDTKNLLFVAIFTGAYFVASVALAQSIGPQIMAYLLQRQGRKK